MDNEQTDVLVLHISFDVATPMATVAVTGDIDMISASSLAGVLHSLIDSGRQQIVIDLAQSEFVDARGAAVFAAVARRLVPTGGEITIRAGSSITQHMLDITDAGDLLVVESSQLAAAEPELRDSELDRSTRPSPDLGAVLPPPTSPPRSHTDVVDAALRLVTALADATVTNADGVSVTLERHGQLMTVAASNDAVLTMDRHQYETGEGPCLDAKTEGRWFYIESLADETRWPTFVPLALGQGIHSILSSPLKADGGALGALNMYSATQNAFGEREQQLAALFAEQASQILTSAGPDRSDDQNNERFATALAARQLIHQAQGVIMARNRVGADEAIGSLFRAARASGVAVVVHAADVVASLRPDTERP